MFFHSGRGAQLAAIERGKSAPQNPVETKQRASHFAQYGLEC